MQNSMNLEWIDKNEYPFENKYIKLENGDMHYIDEGEGDIILFVHGTPTWSFLYRNFIKFFSKSYRCIAIDNIGFGLSEKPINFDGKPESHSKNLMEFITKLDLKKISLVVHDFGGSIGLSCAIQDESRFSKIIMFNTWLWETESNKDVKKIDKLINSPIGKFLYLYLNISPKVLLKKGFSDSNKLSKKIQSHYIAPFPNKNSRFSLLNIAKSLLGSSSWYQLQWDNLNKISEKKWLIVWGVKDSFLSTKYLDKWKNRLPNAKVVELECGHFVQEESDKQAIRGLNEFLKT